MGARLRRLRDEARLRHAAADPVARGHGAADGRPRAGRTAPTWSPRRGRSCAASSPGSPSAAGRPIAGTELEFIVFRDTYEEAWKKGYRDLDPANLYNVDYSMLGTARVEPLIRRIRNSMMARGHAGRELEGRVQLRPARDQLPLRRGADDRRRPRDLQERRQGDRRPGGHVDHLHGEVQRARGQLVPHPLLARRRGRRERVRRRPADLRPLPRRPARLPARADPVLRPARQLLQALRARLVRADRGRLGQRQPHLLAARRRPRRARSGSRTACRAPTSTPTWRWRR